MSDIRVVYEIEWELKEVRVLVIGQRESAYE